MGGHKTTIITPDVTGLQLQTSAMSLPVPLAWGLARGSPNLIDYVDYKFSKHTVGKGGALGKGTEYTYSATLVMALCEGPIAGISKTYVNNGYQDGYTSGFAVFSGTTPQAPWSYMTSHHPDHAFSYQGICYLAHAHYNLGTSDSLPSLSFEVQAPLYNTGWTGAGDADCARVAYDFLTNTQYGALFPTTRIDTGTLFSSAAATTTGDSAYQTYCRAMGWGISPFLQNQEQGSSILSRWMFITNTAPVWTGYALKFIPYGDEQITGNGVTYIPPTAAVFEFGDDDYYQDGDNDPIQMTRRDWFDANNAIAIECLMRSYDYNPAPIDWIDQSSIELVGRRQAGRIAAHEICVTAMATQVVSLIGARMLYIRNTFTFKLGPEYALYEPMDVGTITDTRLGLIAQPVRIQSIDEDEQGVLTIVCEEFPGAVGTATSNSSTTVTGSGINSLVVPAPVNQPIIFEPSSTAAQFLTGASSPVIVAALSGGASGVADPYWGGCDVYVSADGDTYGYVGTVQGPSRMGTLTASLAAFGGSNPDTADTLAVTLAESGGVLQSASSAQTAQAGATLCVVQDDPSGPVELIGPETATLTGTSAYSLTGLYRGMFGTTPGAHAAGALFARLDNLIFTYALPAPYIGQPLYFKFASFNLWGQATQDLSTCTAYSYTPSGAGYGGGSGGVPSAPTGLSCSASGTTTLLGWLANAATDNVTTYQVFRAPSAGASFGSASLIATTPGLTWTDAALTAGASYTYFVKAVNAVGTSAPSAGLNATASTTGAGPVILGFQRNVSAITPSDVVASWQINPAYSLPAGLPGSDLTVAGASAQAPTADTTLTLQVAGVAVGSVTIAAGSLTGTFSMAASQAVASNAVVELIAPASLNGMIGYLTGSLAGVR